MSETIDYPSELDEYLTLPNEKRVRIRALRRCEEGPIRELYARLSPRSRYFRFFSPMPTLPDSLVRMLACVDYRRQLALLAEYDNGRGSEVIGLGSFGAVEKDDVSGDVNGDVEVALVIRDDWQRLRIGTEMARRIMKAAEDRGFHRFIVHMHAENVATRRLLKHVGEIVSATMHGAMSEVAFVARRLSAV